MMISMQFLTEMSLKTLQDGTKKIIINAEAFNQQPRRRASEVCCSHKVVVVGFNTLCYDAKRRGIKPSARIRARGKETVGVVSPQTPCLLLFLKIQQSNKISILETVELVRASAHTYISEFSKENSKLN